MSELRVVLVDQGGRKGHDIDDGGPISVFLVHAGDYVHVLKSATNGQS